MKERGNFTDYLKTIQRLYEAAEEEIMGGNAPGFRKYEAAAIGPNQKTPLKTN